MHEVLGWCHISWPLQVQQRWRDDFCYERWFANTKSKADLCFSGNHSETELDFWRSGMVVDRLGRLGGHFVVERKQTSRSCLTFILRRWIFVDWHDLQTFLFLESCHGSLVRVPSCYKFFWDLLGVSFSHWNVNPTSPLQSGTWPRGPFMFELTLVGLRSIWKYLWHSNDCSWIAWKMPVSSFVQANSDQLNITDLS